MITLSHSLTAPAVHLGKSERLHWPPPLLLLLPPRFRLLFPCFLNPKSLLQSKGNPVQPLRSRSHLRIKLLKSMTMPPTADLSYQSSTCSTCSKQ